MKSVIETWLVDYFYFFFQCFDHPLGTLDFFLHLFYHGISIFRFGKESDVILPQYDITFKLFYFCKELIPFVPYFSGGFWISFQAVKFCLVLKDALIVIADFKLVEFLIQGNSVPVCYFVLPVKGDKTNFRPLSLQFFQAVKRCLYIRTGFKFLKFLNDGNLCFKVILVWGIKIGEELGLDRKSVV